MRRFLIEPGAVRDRYFRLTGPEAHHALRVLRLKTGDELLLLDGQGLEFQARILALGRREIDLEILETRAAANEPALELVLGQALIKPDRMELIVQKGTELGLSVLVPLTTERTLAGKETLPSSRRIERWQDLSRQSLKQCRRGRSVRILEPEPLGGFLEQASETDLNILLYESRIDPLTGWGALGSVSPRPERVVALVGPEGGFTPEEAAAAVSRGFVPVGLGPRILRAETAALAAMVLLMNMFGDLA